MDTLGKFNFLQSRIPPQVANTIHALFNNNLPQSITTWKTLRNFDAARDPNFLQTSAAKTTGAKLF